MTEWRQAQLLCPTCGEPLDPRQTLWPVAGRWHCSEPCAAQALPMVRTAVD